MEFNDFKKFTNLSEMFTDEQIMVLKSSGLEDIIDIVNNYNGVACVDSEDLSQIFMNKEIVYAQRYELGSFPIIPIIDFDVALFLICVSSVERYIDFTVGELNKNVEFVRKASMSDRTSVFSGVIHYNKNSNYDSGYDECIVIYGKYKFRDRMPKSFYEESDFITNSFYKCVECNGIKPLTYNMKTCPCCGKSTQESIRIGVNILKKLRGPDFSSIDSKKQVIVETLEKLSRLDEIKCAISAENLVEYYLRQFNFFYGSTETQKFINKIIVKKLFGYHSYEINLDYKKNISVIYGTNALGKTTIFKLLETILVGGKPDLILDYLFGQLFEEITIFFSDNTYIKTSKNSRMIEFEYNHPYFICQDNHKEKLIIKNKKDFEGIKKHFDIINNIMFPKLKGNTKNLRDNKFVFVKVNRDSLISDLIEIETLRRNLINKSNDKEIFNNNYNEEVIMQITQAIRIPDFVDDFHRQIDQINKNREFRKLCSDEKAKIYVEDLNSKNSIINSWNFIKKSGMFNTIEKIDIENKIEEMSFDHKVGTFPHFYKGIIDACDLVMKYNEFKSLFESYYYEYDPSNKKVSFDAKTRKLILKCKKNLDDQEYLVQLGFEKLSSGEINVAKTLYSLIFKTTTDSIVLIDEPELSLHIVWQKRFTNVVKRIIREKGRMQVIVASHSPFIVSGHEEYLVEPKLLKEENNHE